VTAGATITAGQVVYEDTAASNVAKLADANSATASVVAGIALQNVATGQFLDIVYDDDDFTPGATLSVTAVNSSGIYILSATAGGIAVTGDAAATMYPVVIFVAKSTTKAKVKITNGTTVLA
jgi:hypothetical protein